MNDEYSRIAMNAISHAALMVQHSMQQVIYDYQIPSAIYKPKVFRDGDAWCALYGDNIQEGVCGFGDTPANAVHDFNQCWNGLGKYAPVTDEQEK
jgi:hypothetical protein